MTKKTIRFALEILAGLIAGMVILAGIGIWRLSSGPISLDYLTTTIEETLNSEQDLVEINIEDTVLTWGGWSRAIDVVARDVFVSQKDGVMLAHFPEVSIGLSMRALTKGIVAPTSLELRAPELSITRYEDGHFGIDMTPSDDQPGLQTENGVFAIYEALQKKPGEGGMLGYLARISIDGAVFTYKDRLKNKIWHSPETSLIFERDKNQVTGNLKAQLAINEKVVDFSIGAVHQYGDELTYFLANLDGLPPEMVLHMAPNLEGFVGGKNNISGNLELAIDKDARIRAGDFLVFSDYGEITGGVDLDENGSDIELELDLVDFDFSALAEGAKDLAPLKALEAKVNASIKASGTLAGDVTEMTMSVAIEDGKINLPDLYEEKLTIKAASFDIIANDNFNQLDITKGRIDVGEGVITLGGKTRVEDGLRDIRLSATLVDFQMENLHKYWPQSMGTDAWNWVVPNIPKGNVLEASINMLGSLSTNGSNQFELVDMGGKITAKDVEVNYLDPMPMASGGVATAEFGPGWFKVYIDEGYVDNVVLNQGYVEITNIGVTDNLVVDLDFSGPVDELLVNLDREPLMFLDDLGFEREGTTGQADVKVNLALEIRHDLTADQVTVRAEADMSDLFIPDAYDGHSGRAEKLSLVVDNDGMDVKGAVALSDNLLDVQWRENFDETTQIKSRFVLAGELDKKALETFGYGPEEYAEGDFGLNLTLDEMRSGEKWVDTSIDLTKASLVAPLLNWEKPVDEYGLLTLKAEILPDGRVIISPLSLISDGLVFDGAMSFAEHGKRFVDFDAYRLDMGVNSLSGSVIQNNTDRFIVRVLGPRFDVAGLTGTGKEEEQAETAPDEEPSDIAIDITAGFDILTDGPDSRLDDVTFDLVYDNQALQVFHLTSLAGKEPFSIHYNPARFGGYDIDIRAKNAGAVLAQLDVSGRIEGGELVITGTREKADGPVFGVASVRDFTVIEAPAIVKILEFMSLTGISSALTQSGLPFSNLDAEFNYNDGVLDLTRGLAFGSSIGITTEGKIDVDNKEYALKGTVAPIYSLSRAVSWIPVLGTLLSGDGGIFAARYTIGGTMEDPDVSVNPIAAITPGVLRNIFDVFGDEETLTRDEGKVEEVTPEAVEKKPPQDNKK